MLERLVVVVEPAGGDDAPAGVDLVAKAAELARGVEAVTWADAADAADAADVADAAGGAGAGQLFEVALAPGALPAPAVAAALADHVRSERVDAVLVPQTYDGRDIAARLSARLDLPLLTNVVDLIDKDGALEATHAVSGGEVLVRARLEAASPGIYVVRPKSLPSAPLASGARIEIAPLAVPDLGRTDDALVVAEAREERDEVRLADARVVVAGGRGLGAKENYALVEELAALLGAATAASRAIVDAGWVPYSRQVGQTGKTVTPDLYVAIGISGAIQHLIGMRGARHVVAINTDEHAPIFSVAELGVVGDAKRVVPRLIEALRDR